MIYRWMRMIGFFLLALLTLQIHGDDLVSLKKRVAVMDFTDKSGFGRGIGRGVADMLTTSLAKTGRYIVIEREQIDEILKEQGLGQSGVITPQSAAKIGQLLGVELMVTGSISEFGEKKSSVGGTFKKFRGKLTTREARSVVDIRLVNVNTGEVVTAESAPASAKSRGLDQVKFEQIDFRNPTTWDKTIQGKAARQSIEKCVKVIDKAMKKIPWEGKVIRANADGTLYMKPGSASGVKSGMKFVVYSTGEAIIDPDTGLSLGSEETMLGKIEVLQDIGEGKACKAKIISGSGYKAGDVVRKK